MPYSDVTRKGLAATYAILYVCTLLWALGTGGGASGGMAFVVPIILGFPWSLLLGLLLLVAPLPKPIVLVSLLIVPPALNVYLILSSRGIFRATRDLNRSVVNGDSTTDREDS